MFLFSCNRKQIRLLAELVTAVLIQEVKGVNIIVYTKRENEP